MIVAFDPGFGNTKVSIGTTCVAMQTAISRPKDIGKADIGLRPQASEAVLVDIHATENKYLVGPGAWSYGSPLSTLDYMSLTSEPRMAIFYAAFTKCLPQEAANLEIEIEKLVIGLPVPLLENDAEATSTIDKLKQLKRKHEFSVSANRNGAGAVEYLLIISGITILAQPVGAYADFIVSDDLRVLAEARKKEIAVIDLGMNTLDLYVIQDGKVSPRFIGGDKVGVRRLIDLLGSKMDAEEVDAAIRENRISIPDEAYESWLLSVMAIIENTWPNINRFDQVILSGGGCALLGSRLALALSRRGAAIHLPENPITTNVQGLYKWAAYQLNRR
jgi:hypothetical protein